MEFKYVPIESLRPNPKNRNKHSEEQIKRLAELIVYQGWRHPIVVSNRSGFVAAGHGRLEAARYLGLKEVPVHNQDFESAEQEVAFGISDNAIASWAELDLEGINTDVAAMDPNFNIDLLGIKDFVIEPVDKQGDEDAVPETPKEATTHVGELFLLGGHRLLCGDSTDKAQVERLMNGEKADMWLTDPPYGVSYCAKNAAVHGGIVKNQIGKEIENDEMSLEEISPIWQSVAENSLMACSDQASYYWFACQGGDQMMMMMMMLGEAGWKVRHELIWVKPSMVFGRSDYHYRHEPIIYGWKKKGKHNWYSDRTQTSVLEFARPHKSDLHPTTKPVELIEYLIGNNSKKGMLVIDTFLGSGSTLIACEKTNRKCYGMEIDPLYCDVIISRWEKYTGAKAIKTN